MSSLHTYLPQDRLRALARGEPLPDRTAGTVLFADISGFTPLTEALHESLGSRLGVEELGKHLDAVYTALIAQVEAFGGSVVEFAGDAITCWFEEEVGQKVKDDTTRSSSYAVACAFALQDAMRAFASIVLPNGATTSLTLKVAVATGPARRFVVGDPSIQLLDVLAGATVARTSTGEHLANKGEILLDEATVNALGSSLSIREWRTNRDSNERFAVAESYSITIAPVEPLLAPELATESLRDWLHKSQLNREQAFLTEFRPCTALFVSFMGIDYDADDAQSKLDSFVSQLQAVTSHAEGTLLQLTIGDKGSYAYVNFGALNSHEDDARRAVRTALEIKNRTDLHLQMGIAQGVMRVGAYGGVTRRTFGALGDDVNLAARLMTTASVGEVLVSGSVHKAISNDFVSEPRAPLPMKGKVEPLPVFAVTGERQERAVRLQEPRYALPMVGRTNELQLINDKLELALNAKGQVIGIVAEAGMGKSRLVAEVIRLAHRKGFAGYGGACQSDAINTPYQAWKSIWQAFFDVDSSAPSKKQIRLLEGEVEDRAPERTQAVPLLGVLLNLDIPDNDFTRALEPKHRQSALRALLEGCLRAAANQEPLLIVIEDLQWIDALSHDLLDELVRGLNDSRVCFVLAYRPPQLARLKAPRLEALSNFSRIELRELSVAEAEQAIRAKLAQLYPARGGAVPAPLVQRLMARSQGNPFYLEELLNYLHDRGLDPRDPEALEKIELPDSLHTLILSRIDRLTEDEKTTLHVASIIGRLFRAIWLTGYYPELGELPKVKADLEQLADMDFTPLDSPEPELAYLFKHIITHEVTYESLPFATRARLHEQLAQYLETQINAGILHSASLLDTLVYHYTHSGNLDKQREYLRKAAQAANDLSAFTTAVEYLSRLQEITPAADPARSALALQLARAHFSLGDYPMARAVLAKAQAAATTDDDLAAALTLMGRISQELGSYAESQSILADAVRLARTGGGAVTLSGALHALAGVYWRIGQLDDAEYALKESLALARASGDAFRELSALYGLGMVADSKGDSDEGEKLVTEVYLRAVAVGNRERALHALNSLGVTSYYRRRDYGAARRFFQQALALAQEIGAQAQIALSLSNLADVDIALGQLDAARAGLREALALALRLDAINTIVATVMYFARLAHAEGQTERSLALWGLARNHPAWSHDKQRELDAALDEWALDAVVVDAGLAKGAELDWDETVKELLKV
jgi:adenylate cyclase